MIAIKVFRDGDQICALMGVNLQEGAAGFGNSVEEALERFIGELRLHQQKCFEDQVNLDVEEE